MAIESPQKGRSEPPAVFRRALPGEPWPRRRAALLRLFEEISPAYDRLNHWLSLGLDQGWRRWAARSLAGSIPGPWLDLASGTGDLAAALRWQSRRESGDPALIRADLSASLLRVGERKLRRLGAGSGVACEMDRLPFRSGSLAGIAQGFALRHCRDFRGFLAELFRTLSPGGRIAILDMRYPRGSLGAPVYRAYFRRVLPRLAAVLGGDRRAYEMMVDSVRSLPPEEELLAALSAAGFAEVESRPGILGAVRLLTARKPEAPA